MKYLLARLKNSVVVIVLLSAVIIAQGLLIGKLYAEKDHKNYAVNLIPVQTEKDSVDFAGMKSNLTLIEQSVQQLNDFLAAKNVPAVQLEKLSKDSLQNAVYVGRQTRRYSQYLAELQQKLQFVPLGIPADGYISSQFGKRTNPIPTKTVLLASVAAKNKATASDSTSTGTKELNNVPAEKEQIQFHKGLDIAVAHGSPVRCAAAGRVIFAGFKGGYGNCIIISHGNGLDTLYGHLSEINVKTNDEVTVNQVIAKSGNTGRSTGPHLHYEVHKNNKPVNPKLFLNL